MIASNVSSPVPASVGERSARPGINVCVEMSSNFWQGRYLMPPVEAEQLGKALIKCARKAMKARRR